MRFAFVFDGLGYGGIERVGVDYCNALAERGHEVCVVNLDGDRNEFVHQLGKDIAYYEKNFKITIAPERYCQLVKRKPWGRFGYPLIFAGLTVYDKAISPSLSSNLPKVDVVIAFSGHYNDLTFVANGYIKSTARIAWLHGAISSYALISDGFVNLYRKIHNLVYLVDDGSEEFFFANRYLDFNMKKIYNPITIGNRKPSPVQVQELKNKYGPYLLMVARFNYPHKDHPTVIRALDVLKVKYGRSINLVFVGGGPDLEKSKKLVSELGLRSHVFFTGYKENPSPYYAAAEVVVHASVAGEGLPTVMLEGMSFGKPIVATDSKTGPREILGDNEFGLLCAIQDPEDMANKVERLLEDKALYEHYSMRGKERLADFTLDGAVSNLLNYAKDLTGASPFNEERSAPADGTC
ncbi:MAG: glycosyltransferase [Coriobacteriaceae bacterium]|nr:glycosyltransferase [Coriobacteriaceae bacterium]